MQQAVLSFSLRKPRSCQRQCLRWVLPQPQRLGLQPAHPRQLLQVLALLLLPTPLLRLLLRPVDVTGTVLLLRQRR